MVILSKSITEKLQDKQGHVTEDEVCKDLALIYRVPNAQAFTYGNFSPLVII